MLDGVSVSVMRTGGGGRRQLRRAALESAARILCVAPDELRIERDGDGRPLLRGAFGVHISVSHCGGLVAVALSGLAPVGVDIEAIRPLPALRLAQRYFPASEVSWVSSVPEPQRVPAFLWLWTGKEAIGKAHGRGLRQRGLRQPVPLPEAWPLPVGAAAVLTALPGQPASCLCISSLAEPAVTAGAASGSVPDAGAVLAVAALGTATPVKISHGERPSGG